MEQQPQNKTCENCEHFVLVPIVRHDHQGNHSVINPCCKISEGIIVIITPCGFFKEKVEIKEEKKEGDINAANKNE